MSDRIRIPIQPSLEPALVICLPPDAELDSASVEDGRQLLPPRLRDLLLGHPEPIDVRIYDPGVVPHPWLAANIDALDKGTRFLVVTTKDVNAPPRLGLWTVLATSMMLARSFKGAIFDPDAHDVVRAHPEPGFLAPDGRIVAIRHIKILYSVQGTRGWMTTKGLPKFGLPELEIRDLPRPLMPLAAVMNAVAQALIDRTLATVAADPTATEASVELPIHIDRAAVDLANEWDRPARHGPASATVSLRYPSVEPGLAPLIRIMQPPGETVPHHEWLRALGDRLLATELSPSLN